MGKVNILGVEVGPAAGQEPIHKQIARAKAGEAVSALAGRIPLPDLPGLETISKPFEVIGEGLDAVGKAWEEIEYKDPTRIELTRDADRIMRDPDAVFVFEVGKGSVSCGMDIDSKDAADAVFNHGLKDIGKAVEFGCAGKIRW